MRHNKASQIERRLAEAIHNIYMNSARFRWTHKFTNEAVVASIYGNPDYAKLPRYSQTFLDGVLHHCRYLHDKLIVFSYVVKGERLALDDPRYRQVDPSYIHEHCSKTGAFVYRDDTSKFWTEPEQA